MWSLDFDGRGRQRILAPLGADVGWRSARGVYASTAAVALEARVRRTRSGVARRACRELQRTPLCHRLYSRQRLYYFLCRRGGVDSTANSCLRGNGGGGAFARATHRGYGCHTRCRLRRRGLRQPRRRRLSACCARRCRLRLLSCRRTAIASRHAHGRGRRGAWSVRDPRPHTGNGGAPCFSTPPSILLLGHIDLTSTAAAAERPPGAFRRRHRRRRQAGRHPS